MLKTFLLIIGLNLGFFLVIKAQLSYNSHNSELRGQLVETGFIKGNEDKADDSIQMANLETSVVK